MKTNRTELVMILDRSGSMAGLEDDTIGGYNSMLERQKKGAGEVTVTTVLFDDQYELLHDRIPLNDIVPITREEYFVRGCTALLDAIGKTIHKIANAQRHIAAEKRADKVLFAIITDGRENASREYGYAELRALVERQKEQYGWEFLFLGANIDAISTASRFGIQADRAADYHADSRGTQLNFQAVGRFVHAARAGAPMSADWKAEIDKDFRGRISER